MLNVSYENVEVRRNDQAMYDGTGRHWYALYIASNHEKMIELKLRQRSIETFLPLQTVTKRWKNRTVVKLNLPLFTGYIFVKISLAESAKVMGVSRVFSIVGNGRGASRLSDAEIETLRTGLAAQDVTPWPNIKVGIRARIIRGPLAGLEGIVVRSDRKLRVVLCVEMISKSLAVAVCREDLDVCGGTEEIAQFD